MVNQLIKICGIREVSTAQLAVAAGANYIGIIFDPLSPRYVTLTQAKCIASAVSNIGAIPVAVFVNHTADEMNRICEATNIRTVQLHGVFARAAHASLPTAYQRIYVVPISQFNKLKNNMLENAGLKIDRDFILIDAVTPGQGKPFNWSALHYRLSFRWFLAGGLNPSNVTTAMQLLKPDGLDVSSGVESSRGIKDICLIRRFVASVRGYQHAS